MLVALNLVPYKLSVWLTPVWILGVGALLGLVLLAIGWGLLWLVSRRVAREVATEAGETILRPILLVAAILAAFGLVGWTVALEPASILSSLTRLPFVGEQRAVFPIEPLRGNQTVELAFRTDELVLLELESDIRLHVAARSGEAFVPEIGGEVSSGEPYVWRRGEDVELDQRQRPSAREVTSLSVTNDTASAAALHVRMVTDIVHPAAKTMLMTAAGLAAVVLFYLLMRAAAPKVAAVALATAKSEISQPLFSLSLAIGAFLLALFIWIPYFTFGEDIKVLKDSGMTVIMLLGIIVALWAGSTSIAEELDGRTALTVLSKPLGRRQFIFGKFLGIVWTVAVLFVILGAVFLVIVAYKPVYDAREGAAETPPWQVAHLEMIRTVPGLVLAFLETVVLAAISVAISTRLPMLANFLICFSIYALGHLTPQIMASSAGQFEAVSFIGQLLATIIPLLEYFNIQAAIATGQEVPYAYLGAALIYCLLYSGVALLLALVLFEDRDLA